MKEKQDEFWKLLEPEYFRANMFCRKMTADRDHGDDLFQDALLSAYSHFGQLQEPKAFRHWLYRIMINKFTNNMRQPWRKKLLPFSSEIEMTLPLRDPIEAYEAKRLLSKAFETISAEQRAIITLHELEGWSISQLSELYNRSDGAIKSSLFRARKKLKQSLKRILYRSKKKVFLNISIKDEGRCLTAEARIK